MYTKVFLATAFTSKSPKEVDVLKDCLFCIDGEGLIERIVHPEHADYEKVLDEYIHTDVFQKIEAGSYLLPGFVDLHVHASQWAQAGTALDIPLHDWLSTYTFPSEAKFADLDYAKTVYEDVVSTLLANGTTTALYFATVHKDASVLLADICAKRGQRGLVGKVVMDLVQECPDYYRDADTQTALQDTEEFILQVKEIAKTTKQGVYPVVTPRFIPTCTEEVLAGLGALAAKYDTHIQSHCSESDWAHQHVQQRFGKNDAQALNDFGLLQDKSVMAHCNFLSDEDAKLFAETGSAIAHCPVSNAYFANSVIPVARFAEMGVDIGLGSDLSGGFSPSLYDNSRQAVMSSRMLEDGVNPSVPADERGVNDSRITIAEAFHMVTAGGGASLSLPIGRLEEGYAWDVQRVDTTIPSSRLPIFDPNEPLLDVLQKIMYLARPENIREVWVQGERVHSRN
ncbi:guanine deaminase [Sporosarcina gallistercoris]|uniref:Guanine deaminase n=1 Tax=Sporosarcina gallistercoris TaxID=2762245 RepID=A0ABR8PJ25_9BACL|nr:guanine deaminase [Sporosarcina gallistercoris]MBD7908155.1 guanine deaminase [Sporosarcina gallistercoris]